MSGGNWRICPLKLHRGEVLAITCLQDACDQQKGDEQAYRRGNGGKILEKWCCYGAADAERGIQNDLSVLDSMSMGYLNARFKKLLISNKEEMKRFERQREAVNIKVGNPKNPITSLSGGNQQKVILGKWLEANADVLMLDNPMQGIDVGSKFEIYHLIFETGEGRKKRLLCSVRNSRRFTRWPNSCIVMYKGKCNAWTGAGGFDGEKYHVLFQGSEFGLRQNKSEGI